MSSDLERRHGRPTKEISTDSKAPVLSREIALTLYTIVYTIYTHKVLGKEIGNFGLCYDGFSDHSDANEDVQKWGGKCNLKVL